MVCELKGMVPLSDLSARTAHRRSRRRRTLDGPCVEKHRLARGMYGAESTGMPVHSPYCLKATLNPS